MSAPAVTTNARVVPGYEVDQSYTVDVTGWDRGPWWERDALAAIDRGHAIGIGSRDGKSLYMLRCWLSTPVRRLATTPNDRDRWHASNSHLLHCMFQPDDDGALHDHPFDFETEILAGGYAEALPSDEWQASDRVLGPPVAACVIRRYPGQRISHVAAQLHAVYMLPAGRSWSKVITGPEVREWGFHPFGSAWVPWRTFIDAKRAAAAPGGAA